MSSNEKSIYDDHDEINDSGSKLYDHDENISDGNSREQSSVDEDFVDDVRSSFVQKKNIISALRSKNRRSNMDTDPLNFSPVVSVGNIFQ